jgi:hypothetical protein
MRAFSIVRGGAQAGIFVCLFTTAAGFVGTHPVALLKPCNTALVYCSSILESRSPFTPARMASSSSPERDASQCSTLQRLAKEREARASRIREICARTLERRASDEVEGPRHLIVLAHGLMGGTSDLSFLKDCILELDPQALVLLSRSNQDRTTVWHGVSTHTALNVQRGVCVVP